MEIPILGHAIGMCYESLPAVQIVWEMIFELVLEHSNKVCSSGQGSLNNL